MKRDRNFYAYLEGWLSIALNLVLFALKYWAGVVTGSVAIIADAWHTLSDSLTSMVVLASVRISTKPADERHPYGHGRAELIGSMIIGILLAIVAFSFIVESVSRLRHHESANYGTIAIVVTVISIVIKEALARYAIWAGKKTRSQPLVADGWHHRSDAISSVIILAGIFLNDYFWWIDGVLGIIVSLIIFYATYDIMKDTVSALIGEEAESDMFDAIFEVAKEIYPEDVNIHHMHFHKYGRHLEVTFHIQLPGEMDLGESHGIASDLENAIREKLNMEATIHMEPAGFFHKHEEKQGN